MCKGATTFNDDEPLLTKKKDEVGHGKNNNIPSLAKAWLSIYWNIPRINFPGTKLDISFTLLSAMFLMTSRFIFLWFCLNVLEYGLYEGGLDASGSMSSIVHSSLLCPALFVALTTHKFNPSEHRSNSPSSWWIDFVDAQLQFCTGYMVYDIVFICLVRFDWEDLSLKLQDEDFLFLGHHTLTTMYMTQNRVYEAGHMSAMCCMFLGELSNPLHNSFWISEIAMNLNKGNATVHFFLETAISIVYFSIRVIIAPYYFALTSWDLLVSKDAKQNLPIAVRIFWVFMIWAVEAGSYSTIVQCYEAMKTNLGGGYFNPDGAAATMTQDL